MMLTWWGSTCVLMLALMDSARVVLGGWVPSIGRCPALQAEQDFFTNIKRFERKWYAQYGINLEVLQGKGRCVEAEFRYNPINKEVYMVSKQRNLDTDIWERESATGYPQDVASNEARFNFKFKMPIFGDVDGTFTVLGTDYDTYSVINGCGNFLLLFHYDVTWLMSRKQTLTQLDEVIFNRNTKSVLDKYPTLDQKDLKRVNQTSTCNK